MGPKTAVFVREEGQRPEPWRRSGFPPRHNIKKATPLGVAFLAAGEGFEPSHTESESAVLPLHKPAISRALVSTQIIIPKQAEKSREKAKNF